MNLCLVSMSHVFFRAVSAVFSSKTLRLSLPCLFLAGCVSHAPQSAISGKQEDKWPDNQLADFLSVDRSAMSAELSRMKKDGLIDYYKDKFILKEPQV